MKLFGKTGGRLMGRKYNGCKAAALMEFLPHLPQVDKGAQINLNKAVASAEETSGQYLNIPQWCEVNGLHVAAPSKEVASYLPQVD